MAPKIPIKEKQKSKNALRCQRYRNSKMKDPNFLPGEKRRIAAYRRTRNELLNEDEKLSLRARDAARKRIERQSRKRAREVVNSPYLRTQDESKAMAKVTKHLPRSPGKKKFIVSKLAQNQGIRLYSKLQDLKNYGICRPELSNETVKKVQDFYVRSDIVYTMPGMSSKDIKTVWVGGEKQKLTKHYLTMYLKEAHALFLSENPDIKIGFSKFCSLRPKNVLLMKDSPIDQCQCVTHENYFLKLKAAGVRYEDNAFWKEVLCNPDLKSICWLGKCSGCSKGKKITLDQQMDLVVHWRQWQKILTQPNSAKQLKSVLEEGCIGELKDQLVTEFDSFREHVYVKRIQANEFQLDKKKSNARVLQIDFAMSYSAAYQDEVQAALWSRASVMLFTSATFLNNECKTFLICSDAKDKDKDTIAAFLLHLYKNQFAHPTCITEEIIWSDGPATEFKNQYIMVLLQYLADIYKKKFVWKFFATSHGKGIVDGVGGRAKSIVREAVMSKKEERTIVQNSIDFANVAKKLLTSTTILHIQKQEIVKNNPLWKKSKPISGIAKRHVAIAKPGESLQLFDHAWDLKNNDKTNNNHNETDDNNIEVDDNNNETDNNNTDMPQSLGNDDSYAVLDYIILEGSLFPGQITEVNDSKYKYKINVMSKAVNGKGWVWPQTVNEGWYTVDST